MTLSRRSLLSSAAAAAVGMPLSRALAEGTVTPRLHHKPRAKRVIFTPLFSSAR